MITLFVAVLISAAVVAGAILRVGLNSAAAIVGKLVFFTAIVLVLISAVVNVARRMRA